MAELEKQAQPQAEKQEISAFEQLLGQQFRYDREKSEDAERKDDIESAVRILAESVLEDKNLVSASAVKTIQGAIAKIDEILSEQVNLILHHPEFQQLEGAWRGLHHLVSKTETDEQLKIKVLNVSKTELAQSLLGFEHTLWDQSPLFKKVYEEEYGQFGGHPYGCLVGDYHFDHSSSDVKLLSQIAQVAASAHCPFITGLSPAALQMDSWSELANPRDLTAKLSGPKYIKWHELRESDDAKYLGLTLPRFLAREPYGKEGRRVYEFNFEEDTAGADGSKFVWANSAYAMATNITRSFKEYGWCSRIRGIQSGGEVKGLPIHTFKTEDGLPAFTCPTEIAISDRREAELAKNGFIPLVHQKNSDFAAFIGAQSFYKPEEYENPEATANENLSARLPYTFAVCRFAHYLKSMVRAWVGTAMERKDVELALNQWINNYVDPDAAKNGEEWQAQHPLASAEVVVVEDKENPGYYKSTFYLRPHYQLEGLTVSLRLVSRLPSVKGS